jgi:DNA-binding NtrC family response regulator
VRELKNYVQRTYILADRLIDVDLAPETFVEPAHSPLLTVRIGTTLDEVNRRLIEATLAECGNVKRKAAETLGISLKTLYNRLIAYQAEDAAAGKQTAPVSADDVDALAEEDAGGAPPAGVKEAGVDRRTTTA